MTMLEVELVFRSRGKDSQDDTGNYHESEDDTHGDYQWGPVELGPSGFNSPSKHD